MAGKGSLGLVAVCGLAIAGGVGYVYSKYKNLKTKMKEAESQNERNDKIINSQNKLIDELEQKLKGLSG